MLLSSPHASCPARYCRSVALSPSWPEPPGTRSELRRADHSPETALAPAYRNLCPQMDALGGLIEGIAIQSTRSKYSREELLALRENASAVEDVAMSIPPEIDVDGKGIDRRRVQ